MTTYEVRPTEQIVPRSIASMNLPSTPELDLTFTLHIGGQNFPANSFLTILRGAGYGYSPNRTAFWSEFLGNDLTDYQIFEISRSNGILADKILTSDRVNEILSQAFPSLDVTSVNPISFQAGTIFKFPTFVSLTDTPSSKYLITFSFVIQPVVVVMQNPVVAIS